MPWKSGMLNIREDSDTVLRCITCHSWHRSRANVGSSTKPPDRGMQACKVDVWYQHKYIQILQWAFYTIRPNGFPQGWQQSSIEFSEKFWTRLGLSPKNSSSSTNGELSSVHRACRFGYEVASDIEHDHGKGHMTQSFDVHIEDWLDRLHWR